MNQTLEYKNYHGSVQYSADDKLLHGRVLGLRDMISYSGTDVRGLEKSFRAAIEEYLAFCAAEGKKPDVPYKGSFNVRVGEELHKKIAIYAEERDLKLNAVVQEAISQFLENAG